MILLASAGFAISHVPESTGKTRAMRKNVRGVERRNSVTAVERDNVRDSTEMGARALQLYFSNSFAYMFEISFRLVTIDDMYLERMNLRKARCIFNRHSNFVSLTERAKWTIHNQEDIHVRSCHGFSPYSASEDVHFSVRT